MIRNERERERSENYSDKEKYINEKTRRGTARILERKEILFR